MCGGMRAFDGDAETALDLLEGLVPRVSPGYLKWISSDNDLDPVRDHPRYITLAAKIQHRFSEANDPRNG